MLGVSTGLADHLARHPEDAGLLRGAITRPDEAELRAGLLRAVGADAPATLAPAAWTGRSPPARSPRRRWPRRTGAGCCT